jgi:hypothetical protein
MSVGSRPTPMPQLKECGSWELGFFAEERIDLPCPSVQHPSKPASLGPVMTRTNPVFTAITICGQAAVQSRPQLGRHPTPDARRRERTHSKGGHDGNGCSPPSADAVLPMLVSDGSGCAAGVSSLRAKPDDSYQQVRACLASPVPLSSVITVVNRQKLSLCNRRPRASRSLGTLPRGESGRHADLHQPRLVGWQHGQRKYELLRHVG